MKKLVAPFFFCSTKFSISAIVTVRWRMDFTPFFRIYGSNDCNDACQERITKVVRRVAKDLIANDETEISEVILRRLFEDLGNEKTGKSVAKAFADWCFERRAQLPV